MKNKKRDSLVLYRDWVESIRKFSVEERGAVYDAIVDYALDGKLPTVSELKMAVHFLIPAIDRNNSNWSKSREIKRINGLKGGAPVGNQNARKQPKQPVNVNDNNNNLKKIIKKESIIFTNFQLWISENASYCSDPECFKQLSENELLKLLNTYSLTQVRRIILNLESEKVKFKKHLSLYKVLNDRLKKENK